jgi:hypothetical protein
MYGQQAVQSGYMEGGLQNANIKDRNPESIPSRLEQLINCLDGNIHSAMAIRDRLVGPKPESAGNAINQQSFEPPVLVRLDQLQAQQTELAGVLEQILKHF